MRSPGVEVRTPIFGMQLFGTHMGNICRVGQNPKPFLKFVSLYCVCLKEKPSLFRVCLVILLISGTILVVQPPFIFGSEVTYSMDYYIGVTLALSASIADGIINVSINLCSDIKPMVLLW